ncbi:MAG: bacteriohemerythrin [Candidatus Falkowbacteria bacterium]|nr:bacteriohemerythrin [Candidatus Falkowbacteria bacterium]
MSIKKLEWEEKYSVGVKELDDQHKFMFATINELLELVNNNTAKEYLGGVIDALIKYKIFHFQTEEKYFQEFNYSGAQDHIARHQEFNNKLALISARYPEHTVEFAFELLDFLEDWLVNHLLVVDQEYKECFAAHGLK